MERNYNLKKLCLFGKILLKKRSKFRNKPGVYGVLPILVLKNCDKTFLLSNDPTYYYIIFENNVII